VGKVTSLPELLDILAPQRGRVKVVTTNGCFDILHVGHLRYLQAARVLGDLLIVALNSDASVRRLKGPERPIMGQEDRAELLAGLACVDYVVIFDEDTPQAMLEAIRPDIHVKGAQYTEETLPEAQALKALGTRIEFVGMVAGRSSTNVIDKIKQAAASKPV
jgi:rfaE bifunctional protein nucleotidyltransferase chain/domain